MRELVIYAPAKLNLYLDVLGKRLDGYHNIETLFEKIDLLDEITIKESKKGINVKTNIAECPQGKANIVYKALESLFEIAGSRPNLSVEINKKIPMQAGLGGGSSDAANVLKAVNSFFELGVPKEKIFEIGVKIGKDVPFFLEDYPMAIARGMGEILEPVQIDSILHHIIIKPEIGFSTAEMYKRIDCLERTGKRYSLKNTVKALQEKDISLLEANYYNVFEEVIDKDKSEFIKVKRIFSNIGVCHSLLTGSGSAVFCTYRNQLEASDALGKIQGIDGIEKFLCKTYKGGPTN
jgi:4-diphosphocytidyl-2-C-methyl-D-erythritol kinase